jgi:hypothetical protein
MATSHPKQGRSSLEREFGPMKRNPRPYYQIKIRGHLEKDWSGWFEGLAIKKTVDGNTVISGPVVDQAALYSLLKKVNQLGLQLISIYEIKDFGIENEMNDDNRF